MSHGTVGLYVSQYFLATIIFMSLGTVYQYNSQYSLSLQLSLCLSALFVCTTHSTLSLATTICMSHCTNCLYVSLYSSSLLLSVCLIALSVCMSHCTVCLHVSQYYPYSSPPKTFFYLIPSQRWDDPSGWSWSSLSRCGSPWCRSPHHANASAVWTWNHRLRCF